MKSRDLPAHARALEELSRLHVESREHLTPVLAYYIVSSKNDRASLAIATERVDGVLEKLKIVRDALVDVQRPNNRVKLREAASELVVAMQELKAEISNPRLSRRAVMAVNCLRRIRDFDWLGVPSRA